MEAKKPKLEAKSILKKSGKYLYNQDGTPVLVNGQYLYLNDDGSTTLLSTHPDHDSLEKEVEKITGQTSEAADELSMDLDTSLTQAVMSEDDGAGPTVIAGDESEQRLEASGSEPGWDVTATRLLLSLYKVMKELVDQRKIPTLKQMWVKMSGRLREHGYNFTAGQIENRYKTLVRSYRRKLEAIARRGSRPPRDFPYERELKELYEKERRSPDTLVTTNGEAISIADFLEAAGLAGGQRQSQFVAGPSQQRKILTLTPKMASKLHLGRTPAAASTPVRSATATGANPSYFSNLSRRGDVMEELRDLRSNTLEKLRTMEDKRDAFNQKVLQELKYRNDLLEKLLEHIP